MAFPYPPKPWTDGQTIIYPASGGYQLTGTYKLSKNLWEFVRELPEVVRIDQVIIAPTPPQEVADGQLWFDSSEGELRLYIYTEDIDAWLPTTPLAGTGGGNTKVKFSEFNPPAGLNPDGYDFWVQTTDGALYYWYESDWFRPLTRSSTNLVDLDNVPVLRNLPDIEPSDYVVQADANELFAQSINLLDQQKPDMEISASAPANPTNGEFWFDEDFDTLYIWATDHWVTVAVGDRGEVQFLPIVGGTMKGHINLVADAVESAHPVTFNQFKTETDSINAEIENLKVEKGSSRGYDCGSLIGGVPRAGEISFNNASPASVTRVGLAAADKFGQISPVPNAGDIVEVQGPRGETSRYTYVSGSLDSMTVTFVSSNDSAFVLNDVYVIFVYPQNKQGASEQYVDDAVATKVAKAGDTMTGGLNINFAGEAINVRDLLRLFGDGSITQPAALPNDQPENVVNRKNLTDAQAATLQDSKDYTDQKTANISVDTSDFVSKSTTGAQTLAGSLTGQYFYGKSSTNDTGFMTRKAILDEIAKTSGFTAGDKVAASSSSSAKAGGFYESGGNLYYKKL